MHIGIIYYSITGTTEEFARRIANKLMEANHHVSLVKLTTNVEVTGPGQRFEIKNPPDCSKFDFILLGGPVWAFSACSVILEFIKKSPGIRGKKMLPFVTMGFPFKFLGGNNAINQMKKTAEKMGAMVLPGIIVPKLFRDYYKLMDESASKIPILIKELNS